MSLITCCECGREISDKSQCCIGCGCPIERSIETSNTPEKQQINQQAIETENHSEPVDSTPSPKKSNKGVLLWSGLILLVLLSVVINTSNKNKIVWSVHDKAELCKAYIGKTMHKNPVIMTHYKTDDSGQVYVKYTRNDDTTWRYVCSVGSSSIVWAGYLTDVTPAKWGRWREEDRAKLTLDKDQKLATIKNDSFTATVRL